MRRYYTISMMALSLLAATFVGQATEPMVLFSSTVSSPEEALSILAKYEKDYDENRCFSVHFTPSTDTHYLYHMRITRIPWNDLKVICRLLTGSFLMSLGLWCARQSILASVFGTGSLLNLELMSPYVYYIGMMLGLIGGAHVIGTAGLRETRTFDEFQELIRKRLMPEQTAMTFVK